MKATFFSGLLLLVISMNAQAGGLAQAAFPDNSYQQQYYYQPQQQSYPRTYGNIPSQNPMEIVQQAQQQQQQIRQEYYRQQQIEAQRQQRLQEYYRQQQQQQEAQRQNQEFNAAIERLARDWRSSNSGNNTAQRSYNPYSEQNYTKTLCDRAPGNQTLSAQIIQFGYDCTQYGHSMSEYSAGYLAIEADKELSTLR